jgi:hypothetical protein
MTGETPRYTIRWRPEVIEASRRCRVLLDGLTGKHNKDTVVSGQAFNRFEKSLRRKCSKRGLDADALIAAAGVKPLHASTKFAGIPSKVIPRIERETR